MKILKIFFITSCLIFSSGCFQTTSLLGPGVTVATTGNVFQAGLQYGANTAIKNETGKDVFSHIKDKENKTVSGDPEKIKKVHDIWKFSKDSRSVNPNWVLIDTQA